MAPAPYRTRPKGAPYRGVLLAALLALSLAGARPVAASAGGLERLEPIYPSAKDLEAAFATSAEKFWQAQSSGAAAQRRVQAPALRPWDLRLARTLSVSAFLPKRPARAVRLRWLVESRVGGLYAGARPQTVASAGQRTPVALAFAPDAGFLVPVGHQRPWDALAASEVVAITLRVETESTGSVNIDLREPRLELEPRAGTPPPARLLDVKLEYPTDGLACLGTLCFRIDPLPEDPFAIEGDGDVRVKADYGEALAYLDQGYYAVRDGGAWRMEPAGAPVFRAHLQGFEDKDTVTITCGEKSWTLAIAAIPRAPARPAPKLYAERWDVPLEAPVNALRDPAAKGLWDGAPKAWLLSVANGRGKDGAASQWTVAEPPVQKTAWRPVPFWNTRWGRFGGEMRPDFALAARMDAMLSATTKPRPLVLVDGEPFARQGVFTWESHPLNAAQGGALEGPGALLTDERGIDFALRSARYALARWGCYETVSSLLVTATLNAPGADVLHARLARALAGWPAVFDRPHALELPPPNPKIVYALHPLALEPRTVADVPAFSTSDCAWAPGEPKPARVQLANLRDVAGGTLQAVEIRGHSGAGSLCAQKVYNQSAAQYGAPPPDDFHGADALLFDVWLSADAPSDLRAGVHLRDRDEGWYEALLPGLLRPGDWTTCVVDLTERNAQGLKPVGHAKPWTKYARMRVREIGLHVFTTHPERTLSARFARVRAVRFERLASEREAPRAIELLDASPAKGEALRKGDLWTAHLSVNHAYRNPFDPCQADLAAIVTTPSGKTVRVPAFFDQPCKRREAEPGGAEIVEPDGAERWTVRYRVLEEGAHRVRFELREGGAYHTAESVMATDLTFSPDGTPTPVVIENEDDWVYHHQRYDWRGKRRVDRVVFSPGKTVAELAIDGDAFAAKDSAPDWRGFLRVADDRRHLAFDDGSFYYALGPCLRSPADNRRPYDNPKWNDEFMNRVAKRGTYQYDDYFAAFQKAGINWTRVWLCSWWGALQWRRDWPGYQGLGRYNLPNAWRIDHVLDEAARRGVFVNLCLTNHGQFSYVIDTEWKNNPYNVELGGPVSVPREFFTRSEAKIEHQNMLRYIVARWGHSPAVLSWALFSELEFTDEYRMSLPQGFGQPDKPAPHIESWHDQMAECLKALDPNKHLVSTHFSHPVRGVGTLSRPGVDIAMSNAYSAFDELGDKKDAALALDYFWKGNPAFWGGTFKGMGIFDKPVLVEEQGRHWMGVEVDRAGRKKVNNTLANLDADLHCGLWGSLVQPLAGATGYWWWLHVHFDDRYGEYRALANYLKDEDLRCDAKAGEGNLEPGKPDLNSPNWPLEARMLASDRRAYVWVFHPTVAHTRNVKLEVAGASLILRGMKPGTYTIEFWDTTKGERVQTLELACGVAPPAPPVEPRGGGGRAAPRARPFPCRR
ncbi:MAG: hypothetical protein L6R28_04700 [Planctomycetes bacterium]|nr:hypothetical protein [Planctomycetota bacterium]